MLKAGAIWSNSGKYMVPKGQIGNEAVFAQKFVYCWVAHAGRVDVSQKQRRSLGQGGERDNRASPTSRYEQN